MLSKKSMPPLFFLEAIDAIEVFRNKLERESLVHLNKIDKFLFYLA